MAEWGRNRRKKALLFFAALAVLYTAIFVGLCQTPVYDITSAHNDRLFSADDIYYVKNFYSTAMDTSPRVIKHPLLVVLAHLFARVEWKVFGPVSVEHHYMLIVMLQMLCFLLSAIYLYLILDGLYRLPQYQSFLLCGIYALAFSTLFYTFIAESYIFSSLLLLMTYYHAARKHTVMTVLLGVLAAGITITNAALWAVIVFFSGGKLAYRIKVLVGAGVLFCLTVALLPIREGFFSYILPGSLNSARNYSDSFGLLGVVKRVFFSFFGSTVFYLDTMDQSAFGEFPGDCLTFVPSGSLPVILMGLLWLGLLLYAAVACRKDRRLWPPLGVLAANLVLHGVIQYGLKEAFLYSLHHLSAQILIAALLFAGKKGKTRRWPITVFTGAYLLCAVILNLPGYREVFHFITR